MYTEMIFLNADIRFIAINNGVDSANQAENDMTPFINIFNEFYAKDTSRKICAVFKAKGQSGKPLSTNPPYGYVKDPEDKTHWLVDEQAAEVVRDIFRLCVQGYGVSEIANEITRRNILNPTAYAKASGRSVPDNRDGDNDYTWRGSTISHMLSRPEYLGHTVNFKTYRKSYKQKSSCTSALPNGRFLRTRMKPSLTARPMTSCSASATAGADAHQWAKCRCFQAWHSALTAEQSCIRCAPQDSAPDRSTWYAPLTAKRAKKNAPRTRYAIPSLKSSCWRASAA